MAQEPEPQQQIAAEKHAEHAQALPELKIAAAGGTISAEYSSAGAQEKKRPKFSDA